MESLASIHGGNGGVVGKIGYGSFSARGFSSLAEPRRSEKNWNIRDIYIKFDLKLIKT